MKNTHSHDPIVQSITVSLVPVSPVLAAVGTFILQAEIGGNMTATQVFTVLCVYNALRASLMVVPMATKVCECELQSCDTVLSKFIVLAEILMGSSLNTSEN